MIHPPAFWEESEASNTKARLACAMLRPLGSCYDLAGRSFRAVQRRTRLPIPVVCIGNSMIGGQGKTPFAAFLGGRLLAMGQKPFFLSRGYGGRLRGPVLVDDSLRDASLIGDEAQLLSAIAPCVVSKNKRKGGLFACEKGAGILLLDDGMQNMSLVRDSVFMMVSATNPFGNGCIFPAGPLRQTPDEALRVADSIVVMHASAAAANEWESSEQFRAHPLLQARCAIFLHAFPRPVGWEKFLKSPLVAFSGIARPQRFFSLLRAHKADLRGQHAFPDHHVFRKSELDALHTHAMREKARLITTAKDHVRLDAAWKKRVWRAEITLDVSPTAMLEKWWSKISAKSILH